MSKNFVYICSCSFCNSSALSNFNERSFWLWGFAKLVLSARCLEPEGTVFAFCEPKSVWQPPRGTNVVAVFDSCRFFWRSDELVEEQEVVVSSRTEHTSSLVVASSSFSSCSLVAKLNLNLNWTRLSLEHIYILSKWFIQGPLSFGTVTFLVKN